MTAMSARSLRSNTPLSRAAAPRRLALLPGCLGLQHDLPQPDPEWRPNLAVLGDDRRDVPVRVHVESGMGRASTLRRDPLALDVRHLVGRPLLDRNIEARRDREVDGGRWRRDIKRKAVL